MPATQNLKSGFLRSVRLGTGRAYLLAQANPGVDFSTFIIEACRRNFAYDGQMESDRSAYLPAWLNEELLFDSYAKTRLLHQPQLR